MRTKNLIFYFSPIFLFHTQKTYHELDYVRHLPNQNPFVFNPIFATISSLSLSHTHTQSYGQRNAVHIISERSIKTQKVITKCLIKWLTVCNLGLLRLTISGQFLFVMTTPLRFSSSEFAVVLCHLKMLAG